MFMIHLRIEIDKLKKKKQNEYMIEEVMRLIECNIFVFLYHTVNPWRKSMHRTWQNKAPDKIGSFWRFLRKNDKTRAPSYDVEKATWQKLDAPLKKFYFTCLTLERKHGTIDEYYLEISVFVCRKFTG